MLSKRSRTGKAELCGALLVVSQDTLFHAQASQRCFEVSSAQEGQGSVVESSKQILLWFASLAVSHRDEWDAGEQ